MTSRLTASEPPPNPRNVVGDETATLIFCPVVFRLLADGAGFSGMFRLVSLHTRGRMPVSSQPGQPGVEPGTVRWRSGDRGVIAVAGAAGSGTVSAGRVRVVCSRRLPGRSPDVTTGAAVPGLARKPELAAAISGGMALLWA